MSAVTATGGSGSWPLPVKKPWYKVLYVQVLIGIALGVLVG